MRENRVLNHAIHMAAITQIRQDTPGRVYYDKKQAEGKTRKEALRALKRRISTVAVGNYAYAIDFSDGHDTGIYSFTLLLEFGEVDQAS